MKQNPPHLLPPPPTLPTNTMTTNSFKDIYQSLDIQLNHTTTPTTQKPQLEPQVNYHIPIPYDILLKYCTEPYAQNDLIIKYLQMVPDPNFTNAFNCTALTYYCARNNKPTMDMIMIFLNKGVKITKCNRLHEITADGIITAYTGYVTNAPHHVPLKEPTNPTIWDGKICRHDDPIMIFFKRKQHELSRDEIMHFLEKLKSYNYDSRFIIDKMNRQNSSNCVIS